MQKNITLPDKSVISAVFTKEFYDGNDTPIAIYDRYKISILLSDGLNAVTNNKIINTVKNSVLFFRPEELHFAHFSSPGVYSYLDFFIPTHFFYSFFVNSAPLNFLTDVSENRINYISAGIAFRKKLLEIAEETIKILSSDDEFCDLKLFSLMLRLVVLCADTYNDQKKNPASEEIPAIVTKTLSYISENYEQKINLNALAKHCNCSLAYLSRVFKRHIGITIYSHITATRIANAQIMLKNGATVTEACFSSGFNDCSNFIKAFKKIIGKTPLDYKNESFFH